jgi:hypothetical protein
MGDQAKQIIDPRLGAYVEMIGALHRDWEPHPKQVTVGQALFYLRILSIFIQCGRKWGKTEIILYILWRWAKQFPGASCYYISPYQKQSKEIVWANRRVQEFGPRDWLLPGSRGINNTELRLNFRNGSFVKCDGSDNFEAYRGIEPHLVIMEESKDHRPEFWQAMEPNLLPNKAPVVWIGTPPDRECDYVIRAKEHREEMEAAAREGRTPRQLYIEGSSWDNPHNDRQFLYDTKRRLYLRGEGDVWEREYEGRYVPGGASKVFPMLNRQRHVRPHAELLHEIHKDRKKLEWYWWADPAGASCFAVLFVAINPYTKKIYVLDEIYETRQSHMTVRVIGKEALEKRDELWDRGEWRQGYDEAAAWFQNEFLAEFSDEYLEPTEKATTDKEAGLSLIKDVLLADRVVISDRCVKFFWELDNFFKDKKGKYPKVNDHLMDDLRYILRAANYEFSETEEYREEHDDTFRGARISDDFPELDEFRGKRDDWGDVW